VPTIEPSACKLMHHELEIGSACSLPGHLGSVDVAVDAGLS